MKYLHLLPIGLHQLHLLQKDSLELQEALPLRKDISFMAVAQRYLTIPKAERLQLLLLVKVLTALKCSIVLLEPFEVVLDHDVLALLEELAVDRLREIDPLESALLHRVVPIYW